MGKKTLKIFAILLFAAAICVTGITLSQNNEYKKFLELNKKALASDKIYNFGGTLRGECSYEASACKFICPLCGYKSTQVASGNPENVSGICPECYNYINPNN
ncbi:MAG: hypothetical protein IKY70_08040 [Bacteroidales bacterium]|nr:hypothetical protein [Bacteroidales bacterium]